MPVVRMRMKQIRTPNLSAEKARERKNDECSMFLCLDKFRQKKDETGTTTSF